MPIITLQFADNREGRESTRMALGALGDTDAPVFPGSGSNVWIDGVTYPLWEGYNDAMATLPSVEERDAGPDGPATRVLIRRVATRETSAEFDLAEIEQIAGTTLAEAGSLDGLVEAAMDRAAGQAIYDRLDKYEEVTDSTSVNLWQH